MALLLLKLKLKVRIWLGRNKGASYNFEAYIFEKLLWGFDINSVDLWLLEVSKLKLLYSEILWRRSHFASSQNMI